MANPVHGEHPPSHPYFGRTFIQVHDHDILLGRGVTIAQHQEMNAFALWKISQADWQDAGLQRSSWALEEVPHRECIKKTCQALRDCNRQDRTGYASAVAAPTDVALSIEERAKSGLSLKEHAAAVAAESARLKLNRNASCMPHVLYPAFEDSKRPATIDHVASLDDDLSRTLEANAIEQGEFGLRDDGVSPTVGLAAQWLKKQRTEEPHTLTTTNPGSNCFGIPDSADSHISVQSTPAPFVAPVPITATPRPHVHQDSSPAAHRGYLSAEHLLPSHETDSPQFHLSSEYHTESMAPTPYSPVALHHHDQDVDPTADIDHHGFSFHSNDHDDHNCDDLLNTAAAVAASSLDHGSSHHRNNSLTLDDDEIPHHTLRISDF